MNKPPIAKISKRMTFDLNGFLKPDQRLAGFSNAYSLEVSVSGPIDFETGMVMNLKDLQEIASMVLTGSREEAEEYFTQKTLLPENLVLFFWKRFEPLLSKFHISLLGLKLEGPDGCFVEISGGQAQMMVLVTRRYEFSASHRLYNPGFSDEQNWDVFRNCNNINGHGHNYEFEVTLKGQQNPETGLLVNPVTLDELIEKLIVENVDHKHLNYDVPMLEGYIPTAENLAFVFWNVLQPELIALGDVTLERIRVFESKNNLAEYYGPTPVEKLTTKMAETVVTMN